jgi:hypothetical protein
MAELAAVIIPQARASPGVIRAEQSRQSALPRKKRCIDLMVSPAPA